MKLLEPMIEWHQEITSIRRDLHAYPELAYEEVRTADKVAELLTQWDIPIHRGLGITGVVGTIEGKTTNGKRIGLRADMDALPMQELNTFAHASQNDGKCMHVAMMVTPPCCSPRPNILLSTVTLKASFISFSSQPKKVWVERKR